MSPEQARGQEVDKRTDIWAFGCVLYEMLTGHPAFRGATVTDILAAVVDREPDWSALPAGAPPAVQRLVRRCLHKEPRRRLRDIGEVAVFLDEPAEAASTETERALSSPCTLSSGGSTRVQRLRLAGAAITGAALAGLAAVGLVSRDRATEPEVSVVLGPIAPVTFDSGLTAMPSLSADGRLLAYASNRSGEGNLDVYVQQATGGTAIRLTTDPADDYQADVSPDGSLVAFRSERGRWPACTVAPALGGTARLIAPDGRSPDSLARRAADRVREGFVACPDRGHQRSKGVRGARHRRRADTAGHQSRERRRAGVGTGRAEPPGPWPERARGRGCGTRLVAGAERTRCARGVDWSLRATGGARFSSGGGYGDDSVSWGVDRRRRDLFRDHEPVATRSTFGGSVSMRARDAPRLLPFA